MVTFGIIRGEPVIFSKADISLITDIITNACEENGIQVYALKTLPDHVHMVIEAFGENDLSERVRKIKGYSSFAFQRERGWEKGQKIWARKFHKKLVESDKALENILFYVENNDLKHKVQWEDSL